MTDSKDRDELELESVAFDEGASLTDEELAAMRIGGNAGDADLLEFIEKMDVIKPPRENKVMVPEALARQEGYVGPVYGYIREDSGYHVILGWEGAEPAPELKAPAIGGVGIDAACPDRPVLEGSWSQGELSFVLRCGEDAVPLRTDVYTLKQNIFSRNSGLMESDWMDDKCAVISGCGSVGSLMAVQLARSGVGRFILVDTDCMEIHNVCRHQCDLSDIGRFKVDAVADKIRRINPAIQVRKFYQRIQEVPIDAYSDWLDGENTIFIGTCDNRVGNAYACDAACSVGAPFLGLGFLARAWGGEIYLCLPEKHHICYRCAFRKQIDSAIAEERRSHAYMDSDDVGVVHFEPGLDVDIEFGVSLADKLVLDILNRHNPAYHPRMLDQVGQFIMFSGTGDRSAVDSFWSRALKKPVDYICIGVSPESRRKDCEYCHP